MALKRKTVSYRSYATDYMRDIKSGCNSSFNTSSLSFLYFSISKFCMRTNCDWLPIAWIVSPISCYTLMGMYLSIKCSIVFSLFSYMSKSLLISSNYFYIYIFCSIKFDLSCFVSLKPSVITLSYSRLLACWAVRSTIILFVFSIELFLSASLSWLISRLFYRLTWSLNILFRSVCETVSLPYISAIIYWRVFF